MLKIDCIDVFYGISHIIWNVSLEVKKGEIVTLIGANGAGKTTILKTVSGVIHPTTGTITFLGKRIDGLPPHEIVKEGISHVPEGRRLFRHLTVLENLVLGGYTLKTRDDVEESLEFVFRAFPVLEERRTQRAGTLSGGEAQMLAIGRGLMSKPKLLMLDEPSLGLAPKLVFNTFEMLSELKKNVTILLVEQNVQRSLELADRGYLLENGRIVLQDTGTKLMGVSFVKKSYLGL